MSYVLNALRRADAERERGAVPGLHAHTLPEQTAPAARPAWLLALLGALAGAGCLLGGWLLLRPSPAPQPVQTVAAAPAVAGVPSAPAPVLIRIEAPPAPAAAPAPARAATTPPATPQRSDVAPMPDAVRRQLPPMTFGGAMDSEQAGSRMLIINGQVYREGESPAPGLVLERIKLRGAIVNVGGQRFEMMY